MESLLLDQELDDEPVSEELSDIELEELVTTKFVKPEDGVLNSVKLVPENRDSDSMESVDGGLERVRAVGSPIVFASPVVHGRLSDGVVLEEYDCLRRPLGEKVDGATLLLHRIRQASQAELEEADAWNVFEKSKKWKKTSRVTELALVNATLSLVDARPVHLHFFCRRLIETDISVIVEKSLTTVPVPTKFRSLLRINIKTDMPLGQFLGQLDDIYQTTTGMVVREARITALQKNSDGTMQKFLTSEMRKFAEKEHILAHSAFHTMTATCRFVFGHEGREHVCVAVEYHNELDACGRRAKTVMIEQLAKPLPKIHPRRRVTFGMPEVADSHEYEISDNLPFRPLGFSHRFQDLIAHLESASPAFGDAPTNSALKNVTLR